MLRDALGDDLGEAFPIDRQRPTRRHGGLIGHAHDEGVEQAQFGFEEPRGPIGQVAAQRVGADQFGQLIGRMRGRIADRTHFVQHHVDAAFGRLPRRFTSGESAANNNESSSHESNSQVVALRATIVLMRP